MSLFRDAAGSDVVSAADRATAKPSDKCCNEQRCIGVTHTQALAGAYLESTRARTSATVAQRPASISEMPRIALTASSTSCGERCGCSGVMLPDMDDSTIMPQIIPQIASLLLKINVPHCLVTLIKKCCCFPFYGHKVLYNRGMVQNVFVIITEW